MKIVTPNPVTRSAPWLVLLTALSGATSLAAQPSDCPVAGQKIHWIADYCMSLLETDDEIPASPCIGEELARVFSGECAAKLYYKKTMCQRSIHLQQRRDDVGSCIADKRFMGATVRNGGVGGR